MKFRIQKIFFITAAIIFLMGKIYSQQQDSASVEYDKPPLFNSETPPSAINIDYDEFEIILDLSLLKSGIFISDKLFNSSPFTSFGLLSDFNSFGEMNESQINFTNPLMFQYQKEQKISGIRFFFGAMQTAAVGYLAYKHIKKYGLFK
jgi:hypothetical protein